MGEQRGSQKAGRAGGGHRHELRLFGTAPKTTSGAAALGSKRSVGNGNVVRKGSPLQWAEVTQDPVADSETESHFPP